MVAVRCESGVGSPVSPQLQDVVRESEGSFEEEAERGDQRLQDIDLGFFRFRRRTARDDKRGERRKVERVVTSLLQNSLFEINFLENLFRPGLAPNEINDAAEENKCLR
jgi:hypothetical protein